MRQDENHPQRAHGAIDRGIAVTIVLGSGMQHGKEQRRRFLKGAATAFAAAAIAPRSRAFDLPAPAAANSKQAVPDQPVRCVQPFALHQVRLLDSDFTRAAAINRRYLLSLPTDRLMHTFRLQAGLASRAAPLGGWEKPDCELRGHFAGGHYLSACALAYASEGEDRKSVV